MKFKTMFALAVAGAFAVPLAAQASADSDRTILAQAGGPAGTSAVGSGPTGGAPSPQSAGEPAAPRDRAGSGATGSSVGATAGASSAPAFSTLDANGDGQISQAEWDAHYRTGASSGASTGTGAPATTGSTSAPTGTTAGPGTASPRTGPGLDTATSPGTTGHGTPK